eukprot:7695648-Pyramimonas_sp.AAC.2
MTKTRVGSTAKTLLIRMTNPSTSLSIGLALQLQTQAQELRGTTPVDDQPIPWTTTPPRVKHNTERITEYVP